MEERHSSKLWQVLRAERTLQADNSTGQPERAQTHNDAKRFRLENF